MPASPDRRPASRRTVFTTTTRFLAAMRELLDYLARGLVDEPEQVSVEEFEEDDGTIVLELSVAEDDYGKVIGRGGRTANALRTVVKAAATGQERRVLLDIVD